MEDELRSRIASRIDKAEHKLRSAELLLNSGEIKDAISRAYYASFHAARAMLLSVGLEPRSHEGTITLFGLHFVKTGLVEPRFGKSLSRSRDDRENGDYAEVTFFDHQDVRRAIDEAREMIAEARRITGQGA